MISTRRQVLVGGAAVATLAALSGGEALARGHDVDVIVVGAGMSGLNTAWLREQQGLKVLVLEGR